MMKAILSTIFLGIAFVPVWAINEPTVDTTNTYLSDSLSESLDMNDGIEESFDSNLDSMLNLYYVKQSKSVDSILSNVSDTIVPDFPDSVYIQRLAAIPTDVPLAYNSIVKSYIDVYTKKKRASVEVMLGLAQHYFPIFDDIFDYYDIPNEMKYMSIIESALNPRAYSRTRAVGLWQFMYGTGRLYGLEINSLVDERRDPIKSTYAAARFVKDLYAIYGDWLLVIAAYNCGPGNVNKAIRRSGGKTNYWDIYYYLPRETRGHVPAFIAATYVMNYYAKHNLVPADVDIPIYTDTVMISQPLHLKQVSEVLGIPIQELRDINPQYREDIIPAGKKDYSLCLPAEYIGAFIDDQDSIYAYKDSVFFNKDRIVTSPTTRTYAEFKPQAPGKNYVKLYYTVKSGDNLGFISEWYDVRISDLRYWNNIRHNMIHSGQKMVIYKHAGVAEKYRAINEMTFAQKQAMNGKVVTAVQNNTNSSLSSGANDYVLYTVKYGDTIWDIAKQYPGISDTDIMRLNNLSDASKIKPGQKLKIKPRN